VTEPKFILFLCGTNTPPKDALFLAALAKNHRVEIIEPGRDAAASFAIGAAHVVAEGAAAPRACRLALDHPDHVRTLVLSAPEAADDALLARLGEIKAPCLLLQSSNAPAPQQAAMATYQQHLARSTRILIYRAKSDLKSEPSWLRLVADFIDRGERFVVNQGEAS
jgi:pimeloyl-ACP methyl ester carboxylesterase